MEQAKPSPLSSSNTPIPLTKDNNNNNNRDFLLHLEAYLAKRDGVDKLLKISRYASKIILASSILPETLPISRRLKSFESSVGVSRKAFRLGKFVQDINALRVASFDSNHDILLTLLAYGGEGLYYFVEQFVWLAKSGLIDAKHLFRLQKISAWTEFVGYFGSIGLKIRDLMSICEAERRLESSIEISMLRGDGYEKEVKEMDKLKEKRLMKKLSIVQDFADGLMAFADIRDGEGLGSSPFLISSAGLLSALISTHKNWLSC